MTALAHGGGTPIALANRHAAETVRARGLKGRESGSQQWEERFNNEGARNVCSAEGDHRLCSRNHGSAGSMTPGPSGKGINRHEFNHKLDRPAWRHDRSFNSAGARHGQRSPDLDTYSQCGTQALQQFRAQFQYQIAQLGMRSSDYDQRQHRPRNVSAHRKL